MTRLIDQSLPGDFVMFYCEPPFCFLLELLTYHVL